MRWSVILMSNGHQRKPGLQQDLQINRVTKLETFESWTWVWFQSFHLAIIHSQRRQSTCFSNPHSTTECWPCARHGCWILERRAILKNLSDWPEGQSGVRYRVVSASLCLPWLLLTGKTLEQKQRLAWTKEFACPSDFYPGNFLQPFL